MSTIGLYDIDLHHGRCFSLSLPLMKIYAYYLNQGHQVIMMSAYEKTGRYNKILYFKESPSLVLPQSLITSPDKGTFIGYGFYKKSCLTNKDIINTPPSFSPYDFLSNKIKSERLYKKIKKNNLIDWREKDLTYFKTGNPITYINDRDFLEEDDWEEMFKNIKTNIDFVHPIITENYQTGLKFLNYNYGNDTTVVFPITFDESQIKELNQYKGVVFDNKKLTDEKLFLFILLYKTLLKERVKFLSPFGINEFQNELLKWGQNKEGISFKEFLGSNFKEDKYLKFKYRILLKQNPQKISSKELLLNI